MAVPIPQRHNDVGNLPSSSIAVLYGGSTFHVLRHVHSDIRGLAHIPTMSE